MIRFFTKDQYKYTVLAIWAILAIVQACFTELMDDEAYYWVYSRHLDWGYFDHPPMIALLIKAGYAIFHNELGVRLGMVILNVLTLILVDKLIAQKNNRIFYLILAGMGAMQLGGILAVPDIPLIFFATLYFYIYRNFLEKQDWKNTLLLAISMALMFYSKYHGVLLVFFTVLSNLRLLKLYRFYIAVIITTILFFPHLLWQYNHDFPSLQYHLVERNAKTYDISYTLDYIVGQILMFGPLVGWLLLYYAFRTPVINYFERALKFCLIGVLAFFLISTFKGRVEANWTVMIFAPLMILAHQGMARQGYSVKILQHTWYITIGIVMIVRVYMMWDFLPGVPIRPELHHNREWTAAVAEKANGRPVVFMNSYQQPSKYMFYTGKEAYSLNTIFSRRSQYNFWKMEPALWGKEVWLTATSSSYFQQYDSVKSAQGTFFSRAENPYYSYSLIQFVPAQKQFTAEKSSTLHVRFAVKDWYKPSQKDSIVSDVKMNGGGPDIGYVIWDKNEYKQYGVSGVTLSHALQQRDSIEISITAPPASGSYKFKIAIPAVQGLDPTHNSQVLQLEVE